MRRDVRAARPWLVTPDEIKDVNSLAMSLDVNGKRRQTGSTSTMIFKCDFILHYVSQFMVLEPATWSRPARRRASASA